MNSFKFFPEGWKSENIEETKEDILQGVVTNCDNNYNLHGYFVNKFFLLILHFFSY